MCRNMCINNLTLTPTNARPSTTSTTSCPQLAESNERDADLIASLRDQVANLEKKVSQMKEEDDEPIIQFNPKQQRAVRSAAPPVAPAPAADDKQHAIQFSTRPQRSAPVAQLAQSPRAHVVGVGMTIKTSTSSNPKFNGKIMVMAIAPEGGAFDCGQIDVGDMIVGVGASRDHPIRVARSLDEVHDWLLGVEGSEVVLQIEKGSSGKILTATCVRKWVENSSNMALHDHSLDTTSATVEMRTDSPVAAYSHHDDRVVAGILGGVNGATARSTSSGGALYNSAASARSHTSNMEGVSR